MVEFNINNFIMLKFRYPLTEIYINGKHFMQCKRLVLSIPKNELKEYNYIDSIDEASDIYNHSIHDSIILRDDGAPEAENDENFSLISPEEEFWGHCSNLQVWNEHDYDTRLLKVNLAFPLLKQLTKAGDKRAEIKLKEEIINRISSGYDQVIEYLFVEGYTDYLDNEELLYGLLNPKEAETIKIVQHIFNVEFKYVPTIDRNIGFNPPVNTEKIKRIRKFSIEDKNVKGIELKFSEIAKLPHEIYNLKKLKQLRISGKFSELNSNEIIKSIQNLKEIEEIFLSYRLTKNLEKTSLKKIKKLGKKIIPLSQSFIL